jgi:hypothetical protein
MTRKHFQALAAALRGSKPRYVTRQDSAEAQSVLSVALIQWKQDVVVVANVCEAHNFRFSRDAFYKAAGY